jgi:hypothetical protein
MRNPPTPALSNPAIRQPQLPLACSNQHFDTRPPPPASLDGRLAHDRNRQARREAGLRFGDEWGVWCANNERQWRQPQVQLVDRPSLPDNQGAQSTSPVSPDSGGASDSDHPEGLMGGPAIRS